MNKNTNQEETPAAAEGQLAESTPEQTAAKAVSGTETPPDAIA